MTPKVFNGTAEQTAEAMKAEGLLYFIELGRRAPMHRMHVDCILEGTKAGLAPALFIGSTNGPESPLYDPVRNPLTVDQQKMQFRRALPGLYFNEGRIITLDDTGHEESWLQQMKEKLEDAGYAGKSVIHFRSKSADAAHVNDAIKPLSAYTENFTKNGFAVWQSYNTNPADDDISASDIRKWDLANLTQEQRAIMATPDYIVEIATEARNRNPDRALLEQHNIPLTVLDLAFDRMRREAAIDTAEVIKHAEAAGPVTLETLATSASAVVKSTRSAMPHFSSAVQAGQEVELKIASASCNQTGGDWPRNIANIFKAIDSAVEDGADILALEELGLTGYDRGDDFFYSDNAETRRLLQMIADYAAAKDPNLAISVGHPWHFADKNLPDQHDRVKNPLFNQKNKAFNVQTLIAGGEVVAMNAKSYLYGDNRGYEPRHFEEWSDNFANRYSNEHGKGRDGTIMIGLPGMTYEDGTVLPAKIIPFGSPVVQLAGKDGAKINIFTNICHGKWVGSRFEGLPDNARYGDDNPLAQKAKRFDITVCLNPNASPPAANKVDMHYELDKLSSKYCGVFVDTDGLGSSGSTFAQFGTRLMAQNGEIISEGTRLQFADVGYTSQTVKVPSAAYKGHRPHAVVGHTFKAEHSAPKQDGPAAWEHGPEREFEETLRSEALWQRDFECKNKLKEGNHMALSGGNDSTYNSVVRSYLKMRLYCAELGVESYLENMVHPRRHAEVLDVLHTQGEKAATKAIMDRTLTCEFMATDNSDPDTLRAAKTLIEGGTREDGTTFEGIGGKFVYLNIQPLVDTMAMVFAGVETKNMSPARETEIRDELAVVLRLRPQDVTQQQLDDAIAKVREKFPEVTGEVLSYANPAHQIAYENIQARLRQAVGGVRYNVEGKLGISNPNLDEMIRSYATWGGDEHGGMVAGNAHKYKIDEIIHLRKLHDIGLHGIGPVEALHYAKGLRPSAGLTPLGADGKTTQYDDDQLGLTFPQMKVWSELAIWERPLEKDERKLFPVEVFEACRSHTEFKADSIEIVHDKMMASYSRWGSNAQVKIHGGAVAMTFGRNVDHQTSLRTPNIRSNQAPEQAQMTLHCLDLLAQREGTTFEALTGGRSLAELSDRALVDRTFNERLSSKMWTPGAQDGRKMKINALVEHIRYNGFEAIAAPTPMSAMMAISAAGRRVPRVA